MVRSPSYQSVRVTQSLRDANETCAYQQSGRPVTNFKARLPAVHSDFAQEALKDPCLFDFLGLSYEANERDIEQGLT